MKALNLVHPVQSPVEISVSADIRLKGPVLSAHFAVRGGRPCFVNSSLASGEPQWGLWDWDVVELFVSSASGRLPYYEFQVSPLGQCFELEIFEPRKRVNRDFRSGFRYSARRLNDADWEAELEIPLDRIGGGRSADDLVGNAFAILGPRDSRTYWSLFLGPQEKPDFHLPERFRTF